MNISLDFFLILFRSYSFGSDRQDFHPKFSEKPDTFSKKSQSIVDNAGFIVDKLTQFFAGSFVKPFFGILVK